MGDDARPLQTLLWYPSLRGTTKPMTVGDYVQLADTDIHFNAPDEKENRWRSLLKASFDIPLSAVREAKPANRALSRSDLCSQRFFGFVGERRSVRVSCQSWLRRSCKPVYGGVDARYDG